MAPKTLTMQSALEARRSGVALAASAIFSGPMQIQRVKLKTPSAIATENSKADPATPSHCHAF